MNKKLLLLLSSLFLLFACSKDDAPKDPNAKFKESTWVGTLTYDREIPIVYSVRIIFDKDGLADLHLRDDEGRLHERFNKLEMVKTAKSLEWKQWVEKEDNNFRLELLERKYRFSGVWFVKKETDNNVVFEIDKGSPESHRIITLKKI